MRGRVAIVGAGIAGLACARTLRDHGVDVTVYDKGRRPGGRLASHDSVAFDVDLGAQYFTVRDARFRRFVDAWLDEGVVARWDARVRALPKRGAPLVDTPAIERFVGTPSMLSIAAHLARDVGVQASHRVDAIERRGARYALSGAVGAPGVTLGPRDPEAASPLTPFGEFDVLVVCLPSDQAHTLVRGVSPPLADAAARVPCEPCLALGFAPEGDVLRALDFDGLFVGRDGDPGRIVAWLARDSSKPKRRASAESWLVHAAPEWSRAHLRTPREVLEAELLREVARLLALPSLRASATTLRRWSFARPIAPLAEGALFDAEARVGIGGDWSAGGRVEGAFLSGLALAGHVLRLERDA
jgi:predicted NAD/FAD-dependent oxidoreductase